MANTVNPIDFSAEDLATFLAKTVDDGTYADIVQTLKTDQVGEEAKATQIAIAAGQLWSNLGDDFFLKAYPLLRSVALGTSGNLLFTTGAAKTSAYNAVAGEHVRFDGSGGSFTITLDASPSANDRVGAVEVGTNATQVDMFGNGNSIISPSGLIGGSAAMTTVHGSFIWKFDGVDSVWRMESLGS